MKYKILAFVLIFSVLFNNFQFIGKILLSDLIYLLSIVVIILFILRNTKKIILDYNKLTLIILTILIISFSFLYNESVYSLLSSFRTIFGIILTYIITIYYINNINQQFYFLNIYLWFVLLCSIYIIIQNIFYYSLGIILPFDFGQFTYAMNSINEPSTHYIGIIRTGGFFREPSWYAYFAFLALYISFYFRNYKTLGIISLGLIISTSSAGIGLLLLFIGYLIFKSNLKYITIFMILLFVSVGILYLSIPSIFIRLVFFLETGGSSSIRIIEPFLLLFNDNFNTFIGNNIEFLRQDGVLFVNSIVYLILAFGFLGFLFIIVFILNFKSIWLSVNVILLLLTEGLLGRPDFWILIAVLNVFVCYRRLLEKNYIKKEMKNVCK